MWRRLQGKWEFLSRFLLFCTGYYVSVHPGSNFLFEMVVLIPAKQDYNEPLKAEIPGLENFQGQTIHPQFWPKDLDYENKQIVIIGSGATAITLLPALAKEAAHVTMLQRSPSYIMSTPSEDGLEYLIRRWAPASWEHPLIRFKWLAIPWLLIQFCRFLPNQAQKLFRSLTEAQLPPSIKHDPHFKPSYNPFEQRVCFCPDGDFYKALRKGSASIVTGHIDAMTADTIKLKDGQELHPDIIVTATGLKIQLAGGMTLTLDGKPYIFSEKFMWKNCMFQDLPNAANILGYVDASWTLGADAAAQLLCRMFKTMDKKGTSVIVPRVEEGSTMKPMQLLRLSSTYVQKANEMLPKAGDQPQWRGRTSYFKDIWEAWFGDIKTGLEYIQGPKA